MTEKYIRVDELGIGPCNPAVFNDLERAHGWNELLKIVQSTPTYTPAEIMAGQWVPVSERLPENDNSVLGWSAPLGDLTITERDDFSSDCITHWFPFPEPPKEEGKK